MLPLALFAACVGPLPAAPDDPAGGFRLTTVLVSAVRPQVGDLDSLAFSADGKLAAVTDGPTAAVWEVANGRLLVRVRLPEPDGPTALGFAADGTALLTAGFRDPAVRWFDLRTGKQVREREAPAGRSVAVGYYRSFGPGAALLLTPESGPDGALLRLSDPATGAARGEVRGGFLGGPRGHILLPDGRLVHPGGGAALRQVLVWDTAAGKPVRTLPNRGSHPYANRRLLAASPDGKLLAVDEGQADGSSGNPQTHRLAVWGLDDGRLWCTLSIPSYVNTAAFAADHRTLAVGTSGRGVTLYDLLTGELCPGYTVPSRGDCRAASPDGRVLGVLTADGGPTVAGASLHLTRFPDLPSPLPEAGDLDPAGVDAWWGSANEFRRQFAVRAWAARPEQATAVAAERVRPEPATRRAQVLDLVGVLDDDGCEVREKAHNELAGLAHRFEPLLAEAADRAAPGEVRNRLRAVLAAARDTPAPADLLADLRAVEVLAAVGSAEAKDLLGKLAAGADGSALTAAARAALGKPAPDVKK